MFALIPLLTASVFAEEPTAAPAPDPVVAKIEAHYAKVDGLRMSFTQTVASPLYGEQVQTGTVAFARPGKMRWTFADEGKHYIGDGSVMWVYVEAEKQAFKYSGWKPTGSAESLLTSLDSLDKLFVVTVERSDETGHVLTLKPKEEAAYHHVSLSLDAGLVVSSVVLDDGSGTKTTLAFTGVELGPELDAGTFAFTPPDGVEVFEAAFPQ